MPKFAPVLIQKPDVAKRNAIERELESLGYVPQLTLEAQRLDDGSWNKRGHEPSPTFFSDLGEPSDFWKAALKDARLAPYAHPTTERTLLCVGALERNAKGLEAEIFVCKKGPKRSVRVQLPAWAGLHQLVVDAATSRAPVLPFPLAVYPKDGAGLELVASGSSLDAVADALGVRKTSPLWNPQTKTYDLIGTAKLTSLTVVGVDVSIYGDVHVRFRPGYEIGRLFPPEPLRNKVMGSRHERPRKATLSLAALLAAPAFFAPLKAQVAKALGE